MKERMYCGISESRLIKWWWESSSYGPKNSKLQQHQEEKKTQQAGKIERHERGNRKDVENEGNSANWATHIFYSQASRVIPADFENTIQDLCPEVQRCTKSKRLSNYEAKMGLESRKVIRRHPGQMPKIPHLALLSLWQQVGEET